LLPRHDIELIWCPEGDLNPHDRLGSADFKCARVSLKVAETKELIAPETPTCDALCGVGARRSLVFKAAVKRSECVLGLMQDLDQVFTVRFNGLVIVFRKLM
jgi:hypothetical protein